MLAWKGKSSGTFTETGGAYLRLAIHESFEVRGNRRQCLYKARNTSVEGERLYPGVCKRNEGKDRPSSYRNRMRKLRKKVNGYLPH